MKKFCTALLVFVLALQAISVVSMASTPLPIAPMGDSPSLSLSVPCPSLTVGYNTAISVVSYGLTSDIDYTSSNPSCATVNDSGVITAVSEGTATITGSHSAGGVNVSATLTITVVDHLGLSSGESYYIRNVSTGSVVGLTGTSGNYSLVGENWAYGTLDSWLFSLQSDGTATLSNNSYAITAGSGQFVAAVNTASVKQKFTIYRCSDLSKAYGYVDNSLVSNPGSLHDGHYLIRYGSLGYLSMGTDNVVRLSTTLTENCYWSFVSDDFSNVVALGCDYSGYDSTEEFDEFSAVFAPFSTNIVTLENPTALQTYNALQNNRVFFYHAHGSYSCLWLKNSSGAHIGIVAANSETYKDYKNRYYINNLPKNALHSSQCIIYGGCRTGASNTVGDYDLVRDTYLKGAHFVLGVTKKISHLSNERWLTAFWTACGQLNDEGLSSKQTIAQAIVYANLHCGKVRIYDIDEDDGTVISAFPYAALGDDTQYLTPTT